MLEEIFAGKKELFEDGMQSILRGQENRYRRIIIQNGSIVENSRSQTKGVCANVYKNGVRGFASMAEYSVQAAEKVLKSDVENAHYLDKYTTKKKNPLSACHGGMILPQSCILDLEQIQILDICKEVDAYIVKTYPNLKSRSVIYSEDTMEKVIMTSDACDGHVCYPRYALYTVFGMESEEGQPLMLTESFGSYGNILDNFCGMEVLKQKLEELYNHLCDKTRGVYAEAGNKTVILGSDVAGMIAHEAIGHTVEADLVLGGSVAASNLEKKVASDKITIIDYASQVDGQMAPLPVYLDDEGVEAKDAVLVEKGILKGYMHNRETADHFGVAATGNARGREFSDEPLIRMRNTLVLAGNDKLEDMIASVDDGYYLLSTGNGQADLTGEFTFGINMGYEIKKGRLGRAILDTTVSGVAFDMLKTCDMVADQVKWTTVGTCGKKQAMAVSMGGPEIKCQINIGGR